MKTTITLDFIESINWFAYISGNFKIKDTSWKYLFVRKLYTDGLYYSCTSLSNNTLGMNRFVWQMYISAKSAYVIIAKNNKNKYKLCKHTLWKIFWLLFNEKISLC